MPEHEIIIMNVSEKEIFWLVCEHWWGEEMMEIIGEGDNTDKGIINMPSYWNALTASPTLQWYVADLDC